MLRHILDHDQSYEIIAATGPRIHSLLIVKHLRRGGLLVIVSVVGLILGACANTGEGRSPTVPPPVSIDDQASVVGTWEVSLIGVDGTQFVSGIVLELDQDGDNLSGTWRNPAAPIPREVTGTVSGGNRASFDVPEDMIAFQLVLGRDGDGLRGSATVVGDDGSVIAEYLIEGRRRDGSAAVDTTAAFESPTQVLDVERERQDIPGVIAAYSFGDGRSDIIAVGVTEPGGTMPIEPSGRMPTGSVGKSVIAATILALESDGILSIDDRVAAWLGDCPWYPEVPNADTITIRMLLDHSSGIPDHVFDLDFVDAVTAATASGDTDFTLTPEELVGFILDDAPLFGAGAGYSYSDTGYILAGLVIEAATGRELFSVVQSEVLDPNELDQTTPADSRQASDLVGGYLRDNNRLGLPTEIVEDGALIFDPSIEWAGGGFVSNVADLAKWIRLVGTAATVGFESAVMFEEANPSDPGVGIGIMISETSLGLAYGHAGSFPGYRTSVVYWPDLDLAVAVQANADWADTSRLATELANSLVN